MITMSEIGIQKYGWKERKKERKQSKAPDFASGENESFYLQVSGMRM